MQVNSESEKRRFNIARRKGSLINRKNWKEPCWKCLLLAKLKKKIELSIRNDVRFSYLGTTFIHKLYRS